MHLVTYLHPRLPTDSAEEPKIVPQKKLSLLFTHCVRKEFSLVIALFVRSHSLTPAINLYY